MRLPAAPLALLLTVAAVALGGTAYAASAPSPAPAAAGLAAHKALYTLTLFKSKGDVVAARGTMGYEVTDACDGWAVRQRLKMTITNSEGQDIVMTSDYATWEAKNGLKFRFHVRQTTDEAVTSQTDGNASLTKLGGAGEARYTAPRVDTVALPPGTMFPMMHTAAIIAAAKEKKRFLALPLFDGTDDKGVEDSFVVILDWNGPSPTKWPALSALPSTRVHLSFFDHAPTAITPAYEVGMRYWENGVADNMKMDFGDFVMDAKMTEFSQQPHRC
ncbi:MAG: DUF1849 family protein [Acetobacteraceae bacterium]|nr:cell envelope integrity EipB family protein [Pseudomonadota bacterium]